MEGVKGVAGHAFALFQRPGDSRWWSADYDDAKPYPTVRAAVEGIAARWPGAKPYFAGALRVRLRDDDGLRFTHAGLVETWRT